MPKPPEEEGFEVVDDVPPPLVKKSGSQPVPPAKGDKESGERPSKRRAAREEDAEERPSKRRPVPDEDEDDSPSRSKAGRRSDEEDGPRRKGKPTGNKLKQRGLIAGAVGGLLVVALIVSTMYQLASFNDAIADRDQNRRGGFPGAINNQQPIAINFGDLGGGQKPAEAKPTTAKRPPGLPPEWEKFKDPLDELEVYFPFGQPDKDAALSANLAKATGGPADVWTHQSGTNVYLLQRITVTDADLKGKKPEATLAEAAAGVRSVFPRAKESSFINLTQAGKSVRVCDIDLPAEKKRIVLFLMLSGNRLIFAQVKGGPKISRIDAEIFPYFEHIKTLK
ncbi:hypothetical protein [Limnoglobus roseus]|uniref:hypothetical protein n=1 Tax=Limnoglobus roseus TaxID=2598579 RepID=UPI00143E0A84|nr:hypothetical protein [Limnoglobus roseus]